MQSTQDLQALSRASNVKYSIFSPLKIYLIFPNSKFLVELGRNMKSFDQQGGEVMKITVPDIVKLKNERVISMMTAYDYPSSKAVSFFTIYVI